MWALKYGTSTAKSLQPCPTLCDPIDGSPLGSSVPGILQARTLEWVAISHSMVQEHLSTNVENRHGYQERKRGGINWETGTDIYTLLYIKQVTGKNLIYSTENSTQYSAAAAVSLQSCTTLCDPIDGSPPGPAVPGILQARTLEWVAISSSNA